MNKKAFTPVKCNQRLFFSKAKNFTGFTLIELLIVIGIIAILAAGVIVAINPGRQFAAARDITRERHINSLQNSLLSYQVSNQGWGDLEITDELTEICNTNEVDPGDCGDLADISDLVDDEHINQIPVDPQATGDGTGYLIKEGSIILVADRAETRFIGVGITEDEYTEGGGDGETFTCGDDITFTYNGSEVTYGTVSVSDECWMDRNLGASRVAQSYDDSDSYGDLFQWGRPDDGHQERSSSETSTLADSDHPGHSDFIKSEGDSPYDWRDPQNDDMWKEDGSGSNDGETCPEGWRIPSETEWSSASSSWEDREDAFNSDLKLPSAGYRDDFGSINDAGSGGQYWSSSVDGIDVRKLSFGSNSLNLTHYYRASGQSVRCLKE